MSNIYLNVTTEKNWRTQNLNFLSLNGSSPGHIFGSSNLHRYHWIFKLLVPTLKSEASEQKYFLLFYCFNLERNYDVLKSKSLCFLLNKNINFNKNETESKMKNPHTLLERWVWCFRLYKNRELKVKLWWVGARKRRKSAFLQRLFCPKKCF